LIFSIVGFKSAAPIAGSTAELAASLYNTCLRWIIPGVFDMSASIELELMRASTLLEKDPAAAARQAGAILANYPGHDAAGLLLAAACRRLGDSTSAVRVIESLALNHAASALIQLELGRTYTACGRHDEARAALERAVELDSNLADAWHELSAQRLRARDTASADAAYLTYCRLTPEPPDLVDAYVAFHSKRLAAAQSIVKQKLRDVPNDIAALRLLASIAAQRGDEAAAEAALCQGLRLEPCDTMAREQLARLLIRLGRIEESLPLIERLLVANPQSGVFLILKAEALRLTERHAEGLAIIMGLISTQPDNPEFWLIAGNQQRFIGNPQKAVEAYQRAIELRPGYGEAYWTLSNLKTFRFTAQDTQNMQRDLAAASPEGSDGTYLEFALGQALEDQQQFAASFAHYARGNIRARAAFNYDPNAMTAYVQRFKATLTERFFAERSDWGIQAPDPIFIVGLPRSGSTLLEQILASHSQVEGTRELADVPTMARNLASRSPEIAASYPAILGTLGKADIEALSARYFKGTRANRFSPKPRFVDKMLGNFVNLGLIHLMFPRAAIIDSRRHPMGCGFSCYKQVFNPGMNFAYDLNEIGRYYGDYAELMDHIDAVLPGRVHRVYYERLVADTENEVRRLLDYCQLPFEAECLRFYENRRVAQTISSEQVRRPIFPESADQWRHFEPWLDALKTALGNLVDLYPRNP
jgi:tetratricopeptide (TPR) repeat protein